VTILCRALSTSVTSAVSRFSSSFNKKKGLT
jgi:hypothetical protein